MDATNKQIISDKMFKRFFSCFGEANEHLQVDLSGQPINPHSKPQLHPESNVNGQIINFDCEDFQSSELHQHFLQSAAFNSDGIQMKLMMDQDEVESKITTASPSKTQYYKQQQDEYTPQLVLDNQNNLYSSPAHLIQQNPTIPQHTQSATLSPQQSVTASLTEKKLQNYLQQAKFLMSSNQKEERRNSNGRRGKHSQQHSQQMQRLKTYSIDNDIDYSHYEHLQQPRMENSPSSHAIFTSPHHKKGSQDHDALGGQLRWSFNKDNIRIKDEHKKSQTDKKKIPTGKPKPSTSATKKDQLSGFYSHRNSESRQNNKLTTKGKTETKPKQKNNKHIQQSPNQIIDQLDNIIFEEEQFSDEQQQSSDEIELREQLKVLDFDDCHQLDLGNLKSLNKRQTSKTEVFTPQSAIHKRNKGSVIPPVNVPTQHKLQLTNTKPSQTHKKTVSHLPNIQGVGTRNGQLSKKHMTTTTSPVSHKVQNNRLSSGKKISKPALVTSGNQSQLNSKMGEFLEDDSQQLQFTQAAPHFQLQQREFDIINQTISPSSQSSFQFQPKFFKPTTVGNQQISVSKMSISMGEAGEFSNNLGQHPVFRKEPSRQQL